MTTDGFIHLLKKSLTLFKVTFVFPIILLRIELMLKSIRIGLSSNFSFLLGQMHNKFLRQSEVQTNVTGKIQLV